MNTIGTFVIYKWCLTRTQSPNSKKNPNQKSERVFRPFVDPSIGLRRGKWVGCQYLRLLLYSISWFLRGVPGTIPQSHSNPLANYAQTCHDQWQLHNAHSKSQEKGRSRSRTVTPCVWEARHDVVLKLTIVYGEHGPRSQERAPVRGRYIDIDTHCSVKLTVCDCVHLWNRHWWSAGSNSNS